MAWRRDAFLLVGLLLACADPKPRAEHAQAPAVDARAWPEGSALFHRDPAWAGGDSAYSVELDERRVLWLFGDTFVDPAADGSRTNNANFFVRNSVAIQSGPDHDSARDASRAAIAFYWGPLRQGAPASFFHELAGADGGLESASEWVWPLGGTRLADGPLLLFRLRVTRVQGGLGFALRGWDAVAIDDPDAEPDRWAVRTVQPPSEQPPWLVGASVLVHDGFLYAYAARNDDRAHAIGLARWPLPALAGLPAGALSDPQWFTGSGFVAQSQGGRPRALFADGQTELSVSFDAARARFVEVQMRGLALSDPATALIYRVAPRPEGPWSAAEPLLRPPEADRPDAARLVAYAAKAHPEQNGPGLVVSYVVHDLQALVPDDALYYPVLARARLR